MNIRKAIILILTASLVTGLLWNSYTLGIERERVRLTGTPLVNTDIQIDPQAKTTIEKIINRNPLNQPMLNQYYVALKYENGKSDKLSKIEKALAALGWRDTLTQQNLLISAISRNDITDIVARADGLLRRQRLTDEALALLLLTERDANARNLLLERLSKNPIWRSKFFDYHFETSDLRQATARQETLRALQANGDGLDRGEQAMSLYRIEYSGGYQSAFELTKSIRQHEDPRTKVDFSDSRLSQFTERLASGHRALPFEWSSPASENVSIYADIYNNINEVRVRWNGKGNEILLRKRFKIAANRDYLLSASIDTDAKTNLRSINFTAICDKSPPVSFTLEPKIGEEARKRKWKSNGVIPCQFPLLELGVKDSGLRNTIEMTLFEIRFEMATNIGDAQLSSI